MGPFGIAPFATGTLDSGQSSDNEGRRLEGSSVVVPGRAEGAKK
jgi:hypothetical protein